MANVVIPKISLDIEISGTVYTISEGDIIHGLTYEVNGVRKTITGGVRVINASMRTNTQHSCPPEPYFDEVTTSPSIVVDCSDPFHAEFYTVQISSITNINYVSSDDAMQYIIPIVDDTSDIDQCVLYKDFTVFDRIEQ